MLVTLSGMVMLIRLLQPENAKPPMLVTLSGMVMLVSLRQLRKLPMLEPLVITTVCKFVFGICLIAVVGIVTLVSALQPENAELSMVVTLSGIVMLVSALQPLNA